MSQMWFLHWPLAFLVLAGCGEPNSHRVPLWGHVTVGGSAAEGGQVRFVPLDDIHAEAKRSPRRSISRVPIVDGRYRIATAGGLRDGLYRVEVDVQRKTGKRIVIDAGFDKVQTEETVRVSAAEFAEAESPLRYTASPTAAVRWDIDVPPH